MLIDDVTIRVKAGTGGEGVVRWDNTKFAQGPAGGNGGRGGNVYVEATSNIGELHRYRHQKKFKAESGQRGGPMRKSGLNGDDLTLLVPVGTVVHDLTRNKDREVSTIGERVLIARGGEGGRGNFDFRSSRNTSPDKAEAGKLGEEVDIRFELKMIADVGFVGYPNAGKSSLLNMITNAKSKVANYQFTTLEPHLGVYYDLILADIPGLIEGASDGRGLGIKFLRHIERTKMLFHFVSVENEDVVVAYRAIRNELEKYNPKLLEKDEYVFLSKSDMVTEEELSSKLAQLRKVAPHAVSLTMLDDDNVEEVKKVLNKIQDDKRVLDDDTGVDGSSENI